MGGWAWMGLDVIPILGASVLSYHGSKDRKKIK
jgi:hypothetical protein